MKLQTPAEFAKSGIVIHSNDRVAVLGSCFASNVGAKLQQSGIDCCINPFGTLYNPVSVAGAISRLCSKKPFTISECVEMGAGAGLVCSFSHHSSFARPTAKEFLAVANDAFAEAARFWDQCNKVIITLGTIFCYVHDDSVVANCLKRPAGEFERVEMTLPQASAILRNIVLTNPDKEFIFTVSPIRHLADGVHMNQLSKSTLLLAIDEVMRDEMVGQRCEYFPAYEIVMDELRDYRFYAENMTHPTEQTVNYIWERFVEFAVPEEDRKKLADAQKAWKASQHRPILKR